MLHLPVPSVLAPGVRLVEWLGVGLLVRVGVRLPVRVGVGLMVCVVCCCAVGGALLEVVEAGARVGAVVVAGVGLTGVLGVEEPHAVRVRAVRHATTATARHLRFMFGTLASAKLGVMGWATRGCVPVSPRGLPESAPGVPETCERVGLLDANYGRGGR